MVDAQPLERISEEVPHRRRSIVDRAEATRRVAHRTELDAQLIAVARQSANRLGDQQLVMAHAVEVAGIEQGHVRIECGVNRGDALGAIGRAVHTRHAHAAKANDRCGRAGGPELAGVDGKSPQAMSPLTPEEGAS